MKKVFAFVAFSILLSAAAFAQVPPTPPTAPTPPAAPTPRIVRPIPPMAPLSVVISPPVIDYVAMEDALRISHEALAQVDTQAIREQARQAAEQAREAAEQMREQAFELRQFNVPFDFQDRNFSFTFNTNSNTEDGLYNLGLSAVQRRQYDQAITRFDQCIARKGSHADGALYHKAFAQYQLGKTDDALASLAELRKSYAQSRYSNDAKVLEADVKKSAGQPADSDGSNIDIKLLAIQSMQNADPDRAIPALESVLKNTNALQVKKKALFVLANNDRPAAHQILLSYAKGSGNPDLQAEAIRYLVARKGQTTSAELMDIYKSTQDDNIKRAVLDALMSSGDKSGMLDIVRGRSSSPVALRQQAISNLSSSNLATPQELMSLYQGEDEKDLRVSIVRGLGRMGAVDQLSQIIKTEKDPTVRLQAIRSLGSLKSERTGSSLIELYANEQDKDARRAVISALGSQNNVDGLIAIARKETNSELKLEIVRRIADMAKTSKAAADYLMEVIK